MIHYIARILQFATIFGCLSSSIYYLLCLWSARVFLRERRAVGGKAGEGAPPTKGLPPVSILKPLKGTDPDIFESFRSHCLQDYPEYEIIFGITDPDDPAVAIVRQLQQEFPNHAIQLVVSPNKLGANVKVSNLAQMLRVARYEHLIVNDSDIRVEQDYLRRVMAPLGDGAVGMVTCLYRGLAASTLGSRLESLGISTDFCAGVLVARQLEGGIRFGLGSTLAFRRVDLDRTGGFLPIVDFLADDYELGRRIAGLGLEVKLSEVVVETHLPAYDLPGFLAHQMRWARGVRDSRPGGYVGLVSTFGLMWALLNLVAAHGALWSWTVLFGIVLLRSAEALLVGKLVLQDRQLLKHFWLLPVRDLVAVLVWLLSFAGDTVNWRGDRFQLKDGRLIRMAPYPRSPAPTCPTEK
jgi:ceramide glucosyltransferase